MTAVCSKGVGGSVVQSLSHFLDFVNKTIIKDLMRVANGFSVIFLGLLILNSIYFPKIYFVS